MTTSTYSFIQTFNQKVRSGPLHLHPTWLLARNNRGEDMNSAFFDAWVAGINEPASWDAAGASFTGLSAYLSGLAELQGKAAQGGLSAVGSTWCVMG